MLFNVTSYNTASDINSQFHVTMLLFVGELADGFGIFGEVVSISTICDP